MTPFESPGNRVRSASVPPLTNALWLGGFIVLKLLLQCFMVAPGFELHRDEFLHLDQAHHLAWGFESVPPLTSWISWLIFQLGGGECWVKFFPALFGALTLVLVWKSVEALGGGLFARILAALGFLFSIYLRINTLFQPNTADILCWTFVFYTLIRLIVTENKRWLYALGAGLGIGLLNKYNIAFLALGMLGGMLVTRQRRWLREPAFYAIALVIVLPNALWQWRHDFPVMRHMAELSQSQLVHVDRVHFLLSQITFFLPAFFLPLGALAGLIFYKPLRPYRIIGWTYLFTLLLFLYFRGKDYYSLGLYPVLLALGSTCFEGVTRYGRTRWLRPSMIALPLVTGLFYIRISCPVYSPERMASDASLQERYRKAGQLRWENGRDYSLPQDYADMLGWKEMAALTAEAWNRLTPEEQQHAYILCDNYGQAGAINYYWKQPRPDALSDNADYRDWQPEPDQPVEVLIRVHNPHTVKTEKEVFAVEEPVGRVTNPNARERGVLVTIFKQPRRPVLTQEFYKP